MILDEDRRMIRDAVREYVAAEVAPHAARWDREHEFPAKALAGLAALGAYGVAVPSEYGGAGLDYLCLALILEEIAAGDGATSTIISVNNCPVCSILLAWGDERQKREWLAPLAQGKMLGAFCLTEPHVGSEAGGLRTRARRDGSDYVIDGVKQFITSGKNGDVAIVMAVTDPGAGKRGISAFIVPTDTPGYRVVALENKLGQHASDTAQVAFESCRVPAANLIGAEGEGLKIALSGLEGGRIGIAAQSIGMARAAFEAALAYSKERVAFGQSIFDHQAVQFRLADMQIDLEASRTFLWRAATLLDRGDPQATMFCAMAKRLVTDRCFAVADQALQLHGGYGYLADFGIEKIVRDLRVHQILEGTNEIMRVIVSRNLLSRQVSASA